MDTSRKWLSPPMLMATAAMTVALAALIVALAGTAGAGPLASSSKLNKSDKKQVKKIVSRAKTLWLSSRPSKTATFLP